jgi:2-desacetyl-2-hydroxyethyl bacteriochlorophyllide A dehydrogenase
MSEISNPRRFIVNGVRHIEIETFDPGPVPDDGILVENEYTAVSVGTELYCWIHGHEWSRPKTLPQPTGYCSAGRVLAAGKDVTSVQVGDRVACQGNHASHGVHTNLYHRIPDEVGCRRGSLLVMAAIAIRGVRKAEVQLGHAVAVLGLGVVGQFAVSFARLSGAMPVIGIDLNDFRLEKSTGMGADFRINPAEEKSVEEAVRALCPANGVDAVIEATGIPGVYPMAAKLPRTAGRLIALGSPRGTVEMSFFGELHLREVDFIGAFHPITPEQDHIYYPWTKERDRSMILKLMADEVRFPVEHLITHVARPEQCQEIYEMLADEPQDALAVLFDWTKA